FFFSSRRRHTRFSRDWSSDVCSSDLINGLKSFKGRFISKMRLKDKRFSSKRSTSYIDSSCLDHLTEKCLRNQLVNRFIERRQNVFQAIQLWIRHYRAFMRQTEEAFWTVIFPHT